MKIWHAYGSEHSMNLVMIGHFKSVEDAKRTQKLINELTEQLHDKINIGMPSDQYSDEIYKVLRETDCYILSASELEDLQSEKTMTLEDDRIILRTDNMSAAAFAKLMMGKGAKVEVLSEHHHKEGESVTKLTGRFKSDAGAEEAKQTIDKLATELRKIMGLGLLRERYSDEVLKVLRKTHCYILSPSELEHFLYGDTTTNQKLDKIILKTDETEVSAFFKLMVKGGAKVEMFSAHDYPIDEDSGGK